MTTPLLEVGNLSKYFGGMKAVDNVSFEVNKHEVVGIIGPNGAGKTTLLRCVVGILKPTYGRIGFCGEDITGRSIPEIVNKGIAPTFQVVKPFRRLPVIDNVMVGCLSPRSKGKGEWVKTAERRAMDALEFCGIGDFALEPASILSHGDLKRLELARAISTEPELLMLDEPFGGLNAAETDLIVKSLKRLHKGGRFGRLHSEGPAMVIIEHKLADLMKLANRVIVMNFGQVIAIGSPEEVVKNKEVVEAYIGREVGLVP